ncbi:unnamed protein product [Adineta ricciae]|uniref:Zinc-binding loop region of homing endonuclease domain-containing protein n=1 Tax=Adineta ricciae TaxID=249248 RepID=A0A814WTW9_ADIRI|nr:unnamed protein product [Adineta ricciae]
MSRKAQKEIKRLQRSKKEDFPRSQKFLNFLSPAKAKAWTEEIIKQHEYEDLINDRHLPPELTIDQLKALTSITHHNGTFFKDWMECKITPKHLKNAKRHPEIAITPSKSSWFSVAEDYIEFCKANSVENLTVSRHLIALRGKEKEELPLLSTNQGGNQCSHLCDTYGCLRTKHLRIETRELNMSRRYCFGIILQIYRNSAGVDTVTNIKPCKHGQDQERSMDEQLDNSCRKIYVVLVTDKDLFKYK